MQIVINTKQCPCRTLNDECSISGSECYEDDICSSCPLIRNGGVKLPEGHGRIGDLDQILIWMIYKKGIIDKLKCGEITPVFKDATIIEADKEE